MSLESNQPITCPNDISVSLVKIYRLVEEIWCIQAAMPTSMLASMLTSIGSEPKIW